MELVVFCLIPGKIAIHANNACLNQSKRCGNVAAILEFDENCNKNYKLFRAAPQDSRGAPSKKPAPDYFL